jgi:uncharacterized protein YjiS (DUF1127 family)
MSTRTVLRPVEPEIHQEPPRADRRYRLEPAFVARFAQVVAESAASGTTVPGRIGLARTVKQVITTIRLWGERARSRRDLAGCDPRLLRDIGVSPLDAGREIGKPFWLA